MASTKVFDTYPPFPQDVPTAKIARLSLSKLAAEDGDEASALFEACCSSGFFLLDLQNNPTGESLQQDIEKIFHVAKETMALEVEEKARFKQHPPADLLGYKSLGFLKTETGQPDRCEFYNISQDDMLGNVARRGNLRPVEEHRETFASFLKHAQPIISKILDILDTQLELPKGTLAAMQPPNEPSGTIVRLIRYPAQPVDDRRTSLISHTDIGTITLLCTILGGLQILPPGADEDESNWEYVQPAPNCVIVNIGDTMVEWTGRALRSNLHRVTFAPGEQALHDRFSVAYLVRGKHSASLKRLDGGRIPSAEEDGEEEADVGVQTWEQTKAAAIRNGADCTKSRGGRKLKPLSNAIPA